MPDAVLCLLFALLAPTPRLQAVPHLELQPPELDLGVVDGKESIERTFHVVNRGTRAVAIRKVTTTCQCLTLAYSTAQLASVGESLPVRVILRAQSSGYRDHPITISVSDRSLAPVVLHLRYQVMPMPELQPPLIDLGRRRVDEAAAQDATVRVTYRADRPHPEPEIFLTDMVPVRIEKIGEAEVLPEPGYPLVTVTVRVRLTLDTSQATEFFSTFLAARAEGTQVSQVPVQGQVYDGWFVEPAQLHFGGMVAGQPRTRAVQLFYPGVEPPVVHAIDDLPDFLTVQHRADPDHRCVVFEITCRPPAAMHFDEQVSVRTSLTEAPITFRVKGRAR